MKKEIITTIEITDSCVKVLQSRMTRGNMLLNHCAIEKIVVSSDEEVAQLLSKMVAGINISAGRVIGIIPRRFTMLKHIDLPSHNEQEIRQMLALQVVNNVPYAKEDIIYDHLVVEKKSSGYSSVLAVIVHKDVVSRYLGIFKKAGVAIHDLTLSSLGLVGWLEYQQNKVKASLEGPVALIYIDEANSEICFCDQNKLIFSRNVNLGGKDINEENIPVLLKQISLTIGTYQKENMGPAITKIVIVTSVQELAVVKENLNNDYQVPVEAMTPLDNLACKKNLDLSGLWDYNGLSVVVGLGLLFSSKAQKINLMPLEYSADKSVKIAKRKVAQTVLLFVAAFLLGIFAFTLNLRSDAEYLSNLEERIGSLETQVKAAKKKMEVMDFVRQKIERRVFIPEIFYKLYGLTPQEITYKTFNMDGKGNVVISGYSQERRSINDLQGNLVNSTYFQNVNLQYATKHRMLNKELTDFKIGFQVAPTPEVKE